MLDVLRISLQGNVTNLPTNGYYSNTFSKLVQYCLPARHGEYNGSGYMRRKSGQWLPLSTPVTNWDLAFTEYHDQGSKASDVGSLTWEKGELSPGVCRWKNF